MVFIIGISISDSQDDLYEEEDTSNLDFDWFNAGNSTTQPTTQLTLPIQGALPLIFILSFKIILYIYPVSPTYYLSKLPHLPQVVFSKIISIFLPILSLHPNIQLSQANLLSSPSLK